MSKLRTNCGALAGKLAAGMHADLIKGQALQFLPAGNVNNVDTRVSPWNLPSTGVAVASYREPS